MGIIAGQFSYTSINNILRHTNTNKHTHTHTHTSEECMILVLWPVSAPGN